VPDPLTILLVTPDPHLRREFDAALTGVAAAQGAIVHHGGDYRQGIEAARSRRPNLVLVEMGKDLRSLKTFAEELAVVSPDSAPAAVFHPDIFGPDVSESAIIIEAIRAGMRDFLRRPLSTADLDQFLQRLTPKLSREPASLGKIFCFVSNKGGVGKSTLSVNTACGLARRHPGKVLLIDASLQMGVCSTMLDLHPATSLTDAARQRQRLDETLLRQLTTPHDSGLELLAAPEDAIEAGEIDDEIMARILTLARRTYDFVIVDSFPLVDRVMMSVLDLSDRIFIVLESVVPTILGGAKLVQLLDGLGLLKSKQSVMLNRYSNFAGNLKPADVAERLGRPVDYIIPYQKKLLIATNLGRPYILQVGRWFNAFGKVMHQFIDDLETFENAPPSRGLSSANPADNAPKTGNATP
jgi:pilus assembly protein CpaE